MTDKEKRICLGAFAGAHGVKGETRVKTFTQNPSNISSYGLVETEDGAKQFHLKFIKGLKDGFVLVRAPQINTREDAEALKGVRLYVNRSALPEPEEDEFYLDDLVGLKAVDETGAAIGVVTAVYNFGADDLLELGDIPDVKGVRLVPFTKANVPEIDLGKQRVTVSRAAMTIEDGSEPSESD
ncbi:ribosome maturation factor RimM [Hyphococcus sp.]|uniref:ribosome maturation factor RimM n=1 Tax=Hyphococcus sp. TaxID=2038636 RepID=UPI00208337ED|nr:MAG: ribosome maturation factor RimM [Marinicaulis sp.]